MNAYVLRFYFCQRSQRILTIKIVKNTNLVLLVKFGFLPIYRVGQIPFYLRTRPGTQKMGAQNHSTSLIETQPERLRFALYCLNNT